MKTKNNYYVVETSSNLNENPQIEQFTFENDKDLCQFYYDIFKVIMEVEKVGEKSNEKRHDKEKHNN